MIAPHALDHPNVPTILPGLIVVDGPVGVGKTTFISHLKNELTQSGARVKVVDETIPDNLEEYYKDPNRRVFEFQKTYALRLFEVWKELYQTRDHPLREYDFVLCDRYWASTRGFVEYHVDKGNITTDQANELSSILNLFVSLCPLFPEYYLFIDDPNSTCNSRIKTRARPGELDVGETYMSEINEYIRRHNRFPFFGERETSPLLKYVDTKAEKFICPRPLLARIAQQVKCLHITGVEENTTKGLLLPEFTPVNLGYELPKVHPLNLNTREYLMEEATLIASAKKTTQEITKLSK